jgi:hypothetical protein
VNHSREGGGSEDGAGNLWEHTVAPTHTQAHPPLYPPPLRPWHTHGHALPSRLKIAGLLNKLTHLVEGPS